MNNLYERASQKIEIHKLLKTIVSKVQFMWDSCDISFFLSTSG
jgi:hypothetical protein